MIRTWIVRAFLLVLTACGSLFITDARAEDGEKSILMLLWRGRTETEVLFYRRLQELGVKAHFTEIDPHQNRSDLAGKVHALESDFAQHKYDLIYTYGTTATEVANGAVRGRIPILFDVVFDPVFAKFVTADGVPTGRLSGVTNGTPVPAQLDAFHKLVPFRSLCLIFSSREPNLSTVLDATKAWTRQNGVKLILRRVAPSAPEAMDKTIADLKSGALTVDAIYGATDTYVAGKAAEIKAAVGDRIPLFGGTDTFVLRGWLATYSPTLEDMGFSAAALTAKVLAGADISTLPAILPQAHYILSRSSARALGVEVPADAILRP